jgi:hypothetical protein
MGLSDVAGVFSRYFVVGFFLPAFFALVALSQTVKQLLPPVLTHKSMSGAEIAVVGGAALALGLSLLGLNREIMRLYQGYPLRKLRSRLLLTPLYDSLIERQEGRFQQARARAGLDGAASDAQQQVEGADAQEWAARQKRIAEWELDRRFPRRERESPETSLLLPTTFGNTVRAFERHSFLRWGLDGVTASPHIALLLSDDEGDRLSDAEGNVAFFVNISLVSVVSAVVLAVDIVFHRPRLDLLFLIIPVVVAFLSYRAAIPAAMAWGEVARACIDLHRLDLYTKLGLRVPANFADEKEMAKKLNHTLQTGEDLPALLAAGYATPPPPSS